MMHSATWSNGQDMKAWMRKPPGCQLATCPTRWTCAKHSTNATLENLVHTPSASPPPLFIFLFLLFFHSKKYKKKYLSQTLPPQFIFSPINPINFFFFFLFSFPLHPPSLSL